MRQRFVRTESRNAGVVVTVSDRALSALVPMLMSFALDGIRPQRMVVKCRVFFLVLCGPLGPAGLAQCCIEDASRFRPTPGTVRPSSDLSASIGICCTRVHSRRFSTRLNGPTSYPVD